MGRITEWLSDRRDKARAELLAAAEKRARDVVQIREFHGGIYLSYNDVPLMPVDIISGRVPDALDAARKACAEYFKETWTARH